SRRTGHRASWFFFPIVFPGWPPAAWLPARPIDDVVLVRPRATLAHRPPAHRDAGLVHRVRITRDQRVPPGEVLALGDPPIAAGGRQPVNRAHRRRGQVHAVGHPARAVGVVAAPAGFEVEQAAGDVGERQLAGVVVTQLVQAAPPAAVAQRLPLGAGHLLQRLGLPERGGRGHGWTAYAQRSRGERWRTEVRPTYPAPVTPLS